MLFRDCPLAPAHRQFTVRQCADDGKILPVQSCVLEYMYLSTVFDEPNRTFSQIFRVYTNYPKKCDRSYLAGAIAIAPNARCTKRCQKRHGQAAKPRGLRRVVPIPVERQE